MVIIYHDTAGSSVLSPPKFGTTSGSGLFSGFQQGSSSSSSSSSLATSSSGMGPSGFGSGPTFGSGPGLGMGLGGFGSPPQMGNQSAMGGRSVEYNPVSRICLFNIYCMTNFQSIWRCSRRLSGLNTLIWITVSHKT